MIKIKTRRLSDPAVRVDMFAQDVGNYHVPFHYTTLFLVDGKVIESHTPDTGIGDRTADNRAKRDAEVLANHDIYFGLEDESVVMESWRGKEIEWVAIA